MPSPPLCIDTGLRRCFGKQELHQRVLQMFLDEQKSVCTSIDAALAEESVQAAISLAHALVSRAGLIGAEALSRTASELEEALRNDRRSEWPALLQALTQQHASVLAEIPRHL
ncbi:Hpt domain-containing protein [Roseateles violae]|uniref:Hpt domain-containing protein n=1 Tax=Roseateles violae TaxID=3058042 RepID=A0ABT8DS06_9BURK|nr:Hpt domain-containing protein [Pelomonas sp. PFR6]MDN3920763.1 Hpt domain-containing protein [Pelomonas sp. PFR6]